MDDDLRCCGTGTCLINAQGICWCGQQWDGEKMCFAKQPAAPTSSAPAVKPDATPHEPQPSPNLPNRNS
jgi:hypothetical protein